MQIQNSKQPYFNKNCLQHQKKYKVCVILNTKLFQHWIFVPMFISVQMKPPPSRKKEKKTVLFLAHDDPFFCSGVWKQQQKKLFKQQKYDADRFLCLKYYIKQGRRCSGRWWEMFYPKNCYEIHFNSMKCLTGHLFLGFSALLIIDIMQILYKTKIYIKK